MNDLFAAVARTPAVRSLQRRMERGGAVSCAGVCRSAQPFLTALLRQILPGRPIVVVTAGLKLQESFQQDIETWLDLQSKVQNPKSKASDSAFRSPHSLFYPAWEILPHEAKLPHADVISERLEVLMALARETPNTKRQTAKRLIDICQENPTVDCSFEKNPNFSKF